MTHSPAHLNRQELLPIPNTKGQTTYSVRGALKEDPSPRASEHAIDISDISSAPQAGAKHDTPDAVTTSMELPTKTPAKAVLASLTEWICR